MYWKDETKEKEAGNGPFKKTNVLDMKHNFTAIPDNWNISLKVAAFMQIKKLFRQITTKHEMLKIV